FPATVAPSADGIMVGLPPSITAPSLFEVPRSIPIIFSLPMVLTFIVYNVFCNHNFRWPDDLRFQLVASSDLAENRIRFLVARLLAQHLMEIRIKFFSMAIYWLQSITGQDF